MKTFGKLVALGFTVVVAVVGAEMLKNQAIAQGQAILGKATTNE